MNRRQPRHGAKSAMNQLASLTFNRHAGGMWEILDDWIEHIRLPHKNRQLTSL